MKRTIDKFRDHYIVCGGGNTGHHILAELIATGHTGMAAGQGFRRWSAEDAAAVRRRLAEFLAAENSK